jgi:hypothetical protein
MLAIFRFSSRSNVSIATRVSIDDDDKPLDRIRCQAHLSELCSVAEWNSFPILYQVSLVGDIGYLALPLKRSLLLNRTSVGVTMHAALSTP